LLVIPAASAYAGLTVTPSRQEVTMAPGSACQGSYEVRNDYATPIDVHVEFRDWFVLPENKGNEISKWLSVTPKELSLQPGESKKVTYSVQLPKTVKGVSAAMVSFIPATEDEEGVSMMLSVALFVIAHGTEKISWDIGSVNIYPAQSGFSISAIVRDEGNIHLRPQGTAEIFSKNKKILALQFPEGRPVYPGSYRTLVVSYGASGLGEGKYSAVLRITAAGKEKTKKIHFTVSKTGAIAVQ